MSRETERESNTESEKAPDVGDEEKLSPEVIRLEIIKFFAEGRNIGEMPLVSRDLATGTKR